VKRQSSPCLLKFHKKLYLLYISDILQAHQLRRLLFSHHQYFTVSRQAFALSLIIVKKSSTHTVGPQWFSPLVLSLSPRSLGFNRSPVPLELMVDKVALDQTFLRIISTSPCQYHSTNDLYSLTYQWRYKISALDSGVT